VGNAAVITTRLARLRRASLGVLVLTLVQFPIGMYVNLYVAVPRADHNGSVGTVLSNGPATLTVHVVTGLLLLLGAIGVTVLAARLRHPGAIIASAAGLVALAGAAGLGAGFTTGGGQPGDSMGMAVLTAVALLCYAAVVYLQRPSRSRAPATVR
jgi:hypothetical protein